MARKKPDSAKAKKKSQAKTAPSSSDPASSSSPTTPVAPVQAALSSSSLEAPATSGPGARKQERVAFEGTVDVRGVFAGPLVGAPRAQNVSLGGVFVETAHLLEVGDPVVLSFSDDRGGRLSVSGRVRWVTPFGRVNDPTPGMGIEFVGVDDVKRDKLDALLKKRAG